MRLFLFLLASFLTGNNALIVSPPTRASIEQALGQAPSKPQDGALSTQDPWVARIRSTRQSDVEPVSDLLSNAIAGGDTTNFKARMERLRIKSSVKSTLGLRVKAIAEAKKYLSQRIETTQGELTLEVSDPDHLRYLWSRESFRNKVAQAAELSSEPHPWERHNFALPPKDPSWLRHDMITAEDVETGEIVGFCEVAMLLCPPLSNKPEHGSNLDFAYGDDYKENVLCKVDCAPTIANLVVSPDWRRRGVAKGLVKSAERLIHRKWKSDELGLYVEKQNQRAMNLYFSVGYEVKSTLDEPNQPAKWYMSKML